MKHVAQNYAERIMWMFRHVNDHTVSSFIITATNIETGILPKDIDSQGLKFMINSWMRPALWKYTKPINLPKMYSL